MTQNFHRGLALNNAGSAVRWRGHAKDAAAWNIGMAFICLEIADDCEMLSQVEDRLASKAEAEANGEVKQAYPRGRW